MAPLRIVIADDHSFIREMVKKILEEVPSVQLAGETGDGLECIAMVKKLKPDLVILDISMPGTDGLTALREIKAVLPQTKVLMLTMHKSKQHLSEALMAGAEGYLLKENPPEDLIEAIDKIRRGENYVSKLIAGQIVELVRDRNPSMPGERLTAREKEILGLLVSGKSPKEISDFLSISVMTIYSHCKRARKKLGAKNDVQMAMRLAQEAAPI